MKHWLNQNFKALIITAFLIPIITVAIVSISHVTKWYGISNPVSWAVYLSIGIEIAALSALAAISANMGKKVYFPFAVVTLIQFIGNIFFAYTYIDINGQSFRDWVDLVAPLTELMGVDPTDLVGNKRFLAFFAGGMLPIISLSFLHMLVKFTEEDRLKENQTSPIKELESNPEDLKDFVDETTRIRLSESDLKILEEALLNPPEPNENLVIAAEKYKEDSELKEKNDKRLQEILEELEEKERIEKEKQDILDNTIDLFDTENEKVITDFVDNVIRNNSELENGKWVSEEKLKQRELLTQITQQDEELGLYDEPFDNPMIKEPSVSPQNASEMMIATNEDIINSFPTDDDFSDWDVTLMDGLEDEEPFFTAEETENIFQEEPTEEEIKENFSTIEPENENIFQDNNEIPFSDEFLTEAIQEFNQESIQEEINESIPETITLPFEPIPLPIELIVEEIIPDTENIIEQPTLGQTEDLTDEKKN